MTGWPILTSTKDILTPLLHTLKCAFRDHIKGGQRAIDSCQDAGDVRSIYKNRAVTRPTNEETISSLAHPPHTSLRQYDTTQHVTRPF